MNNNAQDYKVTNFKVGNFMDKFGNTWCNLALEGFAEPVTIVLKDPTSVALGQTLYGRIEAAKNSKGNDYWRFRKEQKEEAHNNPQGESKQWTPRDDSHIRAQWAIGQAANLYISNREAYEGTATGANPNTLIESQAKELFAMVDRVKDSLKETNKANVTEVMGEPAEEPVNLDDIPF